MNGAPYEVVLWGWGMLLATPTGGIFLPRQGVDPKAALEPLRATCWSPESLPPLGDPAVVDDFDCWFRTLTEWIASYEDWVLAFAGVRYRRACAAGSPRATLGLFPEALPALWRRAGERRPYAGGPQERAARLGEAKRYKTANMPTRKR